MKERKSLQRLKSGLDLCCYVADATLLCGLPNHNAVLFAPKHLSPTAKWLVARVIIRWHLAIASVIAREKGFSIFTEHLWRDSASESLPKVVRGS